MKQFTTTMAKSLKTTEQSVLNAINLVHQGYEIPFIAKYRKLEIESLSEDNLIFIQKQLEQKKKLDDVKKRYLNIIHGYYKNHAEQITHLPILEEKIKNCQNKHELEDLYYPFKPKRFTKAKQAKNLGFNLLAEEILETKDLNLSLNDLTKRFLEKTKSNETIANALEHALHFLSEKFNETAEIKNLVRKISNETAVLSATKSLLTYPLDKNQRDYEDFFTYKKELDNITSSQFAVLKKGEAEGILTLNIEVAKNKIFETLKESILKGASYHPSIGQWIDKAIQHCYSNHMEIAFKNELKLSLKERTECAYFENLSNNLRKILLNPPLPTSVVMGINTEDWTNAKAAIISEDGKLLAYTILHPDIKDFYSKKSIETISTLKSLVNKYNINFIAISSGKGSREFNRLLAYSFKNKLERGVLQKYTVNRVGSDYIAKQSQTIKKHVNLDLGVLKALSIARRLQDPLTELTKIEPQAITLDNKQSDYNLAIVEKTFKKTITSCIHKVGININKAPEHLLNHISGITPDLSKKLLNYRTEKGLFSSREDFEKIAGFEDKALEQSIGFLKIPDSKNLLDSSGIHPKHYDAIRKIASEAKLTLNELAGNKDLVNTIQWENYVTSELDKLTLKDIATELSVIGNFTRKNKQKNDSRNTLTPIENLTLDMELEGKVKNIASFGAFINIGAQQDGLIHISKLSNEFIKDPAQIVSVGDSIKVKIIGLDLERKRISLSCDALKKTVATNDLKNEPQRRETSTRHVPERTTNTKNRPPNRRRNNTTYPSNKNYSMNDLVNKFNLNQ